MTTKQIIKLIKDKAHDENKESVILFQCSKDVESPKSKALYEKISDEHHEKYNCLMSLLNEITGESYEDLFKEIVLDRIGE